MLVLSTATFTQSSVFWVHLSKSPTSHAKSRVVLEGEAMTSDS